MLCISGLATVSQNAAGCPQTCLHSISADDLSARARVLNISLGVED